MPELKFWSTAMVDDDPIATAVRGVLSRRLRQRRLPFPRIGGLSTCAGVLPFVWIWLAAPSAMAQTTSWTNAGSGDWTSSGNWSNNVPTGSSTVIISNGGTAVVSTVGQATGDLQIGLSNSGSMTVQGGGTLTQSSGFVELGNGGLTVTGTGSSFATTADFTIGRNAGTSTVTVAAGGQLAVGRSDIGEGFGPTTRANTITATVTGAGSVWNAGQLLMVGGGTANTTLTISDGGEMTAQNGTTATIGAGAQASATVTGAGSQLQLGGASFLAIGANTFGGEGNGGLTIGNGGLVAVQTVVMGLGDAGTTGTLAVDGTPGARGVLLTATLAKDLGSASVSFDGGILRASANSTTFIAGFNPGDITIGSGGMFVDSNGFAVTASSGLAGAGGLTKQGAGRLSLTGDNTYAGGTTVETGTLSIGNGGTTGSIQGNVAVNANATLAFNRSDDTGFAGDVSGDGGLLKRGGGMLALTGTNTYAGGTRVAAGRLSIGDGGTTGSIQGNVVVDANATLAFNHSDDVTFAGTVSGGGGLVKQGGGTLFLTGADTYAGGTTVETGTLSIGNGGTAGSIQGDVVVNAAATLAFNHSDDVDFAGAISGGGGLVKQGNDTLTLTGTNSFTGGTTVLTGTLSIGNGGTAGSIQSDVVVFSPATLVFNRSGDASYTGAVSGGGALVKQGAGMLSLTGDSNYAGGTTVQAGMLSIGNGGTAGSIQGNVTVDAAAALAFNRSDDVSFAGAVSGDGGLVKQGAGTLSLTGTNGYAGGTTVQAGMLSIGAGGTAGSIQGDVLVDAGAALAFNRSDDVTFAGTIAGDGSLVKQGAGMLVLTGTNTYGGGTTVRAGTLSIGAGGTVGSIVGDVVIDTGAALAFDRSDDVTFAGDISGGGTLLQQGGGTLTLTGTNGQGGTIVEAGALSIASPDNLGPGFLSLLDGTAIFFTGSGRYGQGTSITGAPTFDVAGGQAVTFASGITGTGELVKANAGTLILDGVSSYTGPTMVAAGTLVVGDSATPTAAIAGDAAVASGAVLSGYGTIGGALVNGGTVIPGGPGAVGVLSVAGNFAQGAGGTLSIDVSPPAASQLKVGGTASAGGTLALSYASGPYHDAVYAVLASGGGVSGRFATVAETGDVPDTLLRAIRYKSSEVDLVLASPTVALAGGSGIFTAAAVTAQHDTQEVTGLVLDNAERFGRDDETRCTLVQDICFWMDAVGHFATADGRAGAAGFNADAGGVLAGAHRAIHDKAQLGIGAGYEHAGVDSGHANAVIDTARVFLYGDVDLAPLVLGGTVGYAHDWFGTQRAGDTQYLNVIGPAHASHDASEYSAGLQLGLPTAMGALLLDPKAGLQYAGLDEAGFRETGAGLLNVAGDAHSQSSLRSFLRLGLSRSMALDDATLVPRLDVGYARELLANGSAGALTVSGNPGTRTGDPFSSRNIVTTGASVDLVSSDGLSLSARYGANVYVGDGLDQTIRLEARWKL